MKRSRGRGREPHDLVLSPLPAVDSRICSHFHHPRPDLQTRHHHRIKNEELFFPLLVMSLLTREIKKALLFAAHTESIIEFLTWVWLSVTFQRSRGRKTGKKCRDDPSVHPSHGRSRPSGSQALPGCPLLQNSVPPTGTRRAQSCQAPKEPHPPTSPNPYRREEVQLRISAGLKSRTFF